MFIIRLELQQPLGDGIETRKVIGCEDLSLDDGEVDLNLVKPTGVNRQMNQHQVGILLLQSLAGCLSTVRRAIVHNPEHPLGLPVGLLAHNLLDQAVEGSDPGGRVTIAEDLGAPDIPGGQ